MTKILLGLPDELLSRLDEYCKVNQYERSELVRHLIRLKLDYVYPQEDVGVTTPMIHSKGVSGEVPGGGKNIQKIQKDPLEPKEVSKMEAFMALRQKLSKPTKKGK